MPKQNDSKGVVATNLRRLMDHHGMSARRVAERAHINNRTVSLIVKAGHSTGLETLDAIANVFQLDTWALLYPWPDTSSLLSSRPSRLLEHYTSASDDGREMIDHIAARESSIASDNQS